MNIRIQVMANQARTAIQQVQGDLTRLATAQAASNARAGGAAAGMAAFGKSLTKTGSQLQWTGRQLAYNFTLPLAVAGVAATHFALANERAMVRVTKVYGDASMSAQQLKNETEALGRSFVVLSEIYGVTQEETIGIAAEWAAAGSSGLALGKQVELTMKTMVLGQLEAADATQALIAIQAQFNQSSAELADTIARLNNVENQTGTTFGDLIVAFSRAAGVARAAGVDVAHLAALTAALVPAAGSAAQAGNALKTIISRLLAPTGDAQDILNAMGIALDSMSWKSADATTRLELLAEKFHGLSDAQKGVVSATLASRYQINKFEVLMEAITNKTSYYWRALEAATNRTQYLAQVQKELNQVLDSSPKKMDRIKVILQNTLADAIQPLLPIIIGVGQQIAILAQRFNELSPGVQKNLLLLGLFLIVIGPLVSKIGALILLLGTMIRFLALLLTPLFALTKILGSVLLIVGSAAWAVFAGTLSLLSRGLLLFGGAAKIAGMAVVGFFAPALLGMWAAIRTSWIVGLRSVTSLLFAGFSVLFAGLGQIIAASRLPAIFAAVMGGVARVVAVVGPTIRSMWIALSVSMSVITAQLGATLAAIWAGWARTMAIITETGGSLITRAWVAVRAVLYASFFTVSLALQGIWITLQTALVGITVAGGRLLAAAMAGIGALLARVWAARGAILTAIWTAVWTALQFVTLRGGGALLGAMAAIGRGVLAALASPWVLAAVAVGIALYAMRDKLVQIWNNVVDFFDGATERILRAFYALPEGVQKAIIAVVNIIKTAAQKIYEWFSYINPFAHHSPSLVENVTNGMAAVRQQFGTLSGVKGPIDSAYRSILAFKNAARDLAGAYDSIQTANKIADLRKAGASPGLIASYANMASQLAGLKRLQDQYGAAIKSQQGVVDAWQKRLDAANNALDAQRDKLDQLRDVADAYRNHIDTLQQHMADLTRTPIKGMQAFDDAIFSNETAQKRLRLQMLLLERDGGQSFDSLKDKIASANGELEMLAGQRTDLRSAGAGSEITGVFDQRIKALEEQKKTLTEQADSVGHLQDQLDKLSSQGEILDLQKALKFDALTREIDKAANSMKELPFDQILAGVRSDRAEIGKLETQYDAASAAVARQEAVIKQNEAAVKSIQAAYDAQRDKLDQLKSVYDEIGSAISDMSSAMSDATQAADALNSAMDAGNVSPALQAFNDAAGGDFTDVGGSGLLGREGGLGDQSAAIDEWTKSLQDQLGNAFGGFDIFAPFKDMWNAFVKWWDRTAWPFIKGIGSLFGAIFGDIDLGKIFDGIFGDIDWNGIFSQAWSVITSVVSSVWDFASMIWDFIGPDVRSIIDNIIGFFQRMGQIVAGVWNDIKDRIGPFLEAIGNLWDIIKPFVAFIAGVFAVTIVAAFNLIKEVAGPILRWLGDTFEAVWKIIKGILDVFIGIFTGDWQRFWNGIKEIFGGIWDAIVATLRAVGGVLLGIVRAVIETIGDIFTWLWSHAIKPVIDQIVKGWNFLGDVIRYAWEHVIKPVWDAIATAAGWLWRTILKPIFDAIGVAWDALGTGFRWVYDHVFKPLFDAFNSVIKGVQTVFQNVVDALSRAWNGIKQILLTPVQWVIDFVWNNGLRKLWNVINNLWGGDDIAAFKIDGLASGGVFDHPGNKTSRAQGGVMPGYSPGQDIHHFFSPTYGRLDLSGGEAVMRPEFTNAVGNTWVNSMNYLARTGGMSAVREAMSGGAWGTEGMAQRFAEGGVVQPKVHKTDRSLAFASTILDQWGWLLPALPGGGVLKLLNDYVFGENSLFNKNHDTTMFSVGVGDAMRTHANHQWDDGVKGQITKNLNERIKVISANLGSGFFNTYPNGNWPPAMLGVLSSNTAQAVAAVKAQFPQITNVGTLGSRPNVSDHPYGKAADFMIPGWGTPAGTALGNSVANFLASNSGVYGLKYLIWNDRFSDGRGWGPYTHPLGRTDPTSLHLDHVHGSFFDKGGLLPNNSMGVNTSGGAERVLNRAQTKNFERLVTVLDRVDFVALDARLNGRAAQGAPVVFVNNGDIVTVNINGDLVLPNISNGADAERFIRNLKDLAK
jgi:TP901 family phage tail tape measure protein